MTTILRPDAGDDIDLGRPDVVIYDSGVGGLTVARHLNRLVPGANTLYVADNGWFPYGDKPDLALRARIFSVLHTIASSAQPRAIVVACNTASTAIASQLDDITGSVPIHTVVPPVAQAVQAAGGAPVALLATPSTTRRSLVRNLVAAQAGQVRVVPSMGLVHLAEDKLAGRRIDAAEVAATLETSIPAAERGAFGGVILGCTHFPWLQDEIRPAFPAATVWSDPAFEVAQHVSAHLPPALRSTQRAGVGRLYLTSGHNRARLQAVFARHGYWPAADLPLESGAYAPVAS